MGITAQLRSVVNRLAANGLIDSNNVGVVTSANITLAEAETVLASAGLSLAIVLHEHAAAFVAAPSTRPAEATPGSPEIGTPRSRVFDIRDLKKMGLGSATTIYRNVANRKFPQPFKNGGKTVWRESAILSHLEKLQPSK